MLGMKKYILDTFKYRELGDSFVKKMKEAERNYEGNLEELQFGVKLWKNGDVTYHANYKGCKEGKNGIIASSAEELLQKLMSE